MLFPGVTFGGTVVLLVLLSLPLAVSVTVVRWVHEKASKRSPEQAALLTVLAAGLTVAPLLAGAISSLLGSAGFSAGVALSLGGDILVIGVYSFHITGR